MEETGQANLCSHVAPRVRGAGVKQGRRGQGFCEHEMREFVLE